MHYSNAVNLTASVSADTNSASGTIQLNAVGRKVLYLAGSGGTPTNTTAESVMSRLECLDAGFSPNPRFPIFKQRGSGLIGTADSLNADTDWPFQSVSGFIASQNGNTTFTFQERGEASTGAYLHTVFLIYSDGEGYFDDKVWIYNGLRGIPKFMVSPDPTDITASTTETVATNLLNVPSDAKECIGLATFMGTTGTKVTAEECLARARYTSTAYVGKPNPFEPSQIWPVSGNLMAGASTTINNDVANVKWSPLKFPVTGSGTITHLWTMRTAVSNATAFYNYGAFI